MADCFMLPNAAELVEELRRCADEGFFAPCEMENAADAIEALMQENAKLKAERDAAIEDLKDFSDSESSCFYCRKINSANGVESGACICISNCNVGWVDFRSGYLRSVTIRTARLL